MLANNTGNRLHFDRFCLRHIKNDLLSVQQLGSLLRYRSDDRTCLDGFVDHLFDLDGKADKEYVKNLAKKIDEIKTDALPLGHQSLIECLIKKKWYNPFPKVRCTERPDAACASIVEGSVIVICDTSPEALILPTSIFDFLQETDDFYFPPFTGTYLRIVRQLVFLGAIFLTPIWYLLVLNASILPEWIAFIVPENTGNIPLLAQLLLIEVVISGLKIASLNTPSTMSNSFSVVGGLLLGDFAVQIGWFSPDVIFYMAIESIAGFTQSNYECDQHCRP